MKEIPFAKDYFVTKVGDVYSNKSGGLKKLAPSFHSEGYLQVTLYTEHTKKSYSIHRIVAITYIENNNPLKIFVNHINGIKTDNRIENLEWMTPAENNGHAVETGLRNLVGENHPSAVLDEKSVLDIYNRLSQGSRGADLSREYGITKEQIHNIKSKKSWEYLTKDLPDIRISKKSGTLSEASVRWICSKLEGGFNPTEISKMSGNRNIRPNRIGHIQRRQTFIHISRDYNW